MSYSNYREIERALADLRPFSGNSASAEWSNAGNGLEYVVYSYRTAVARVFANGARWVSPRKYSRTTSRLQNMTARAWSGHVVYRFYMD